MSVEVIAVIVHASMIPPMRLCGDPRNADSGTAGVLDSQIARSAAGAGEDQRFWPRNNTGHNKHLDRCGPGEILAFAALPPGKGPAVRSRTRKPGPESWLPRLTRAPPSQLERLVDRAVALVHPTCPADWTWRGERTLGAWSRGCRWGTRSPIACRTSRWTLPTACRCHIIHMQLRRLC
jgi:hypothetical protein